MNAKAGGEVVPRCYEQAEGHVLDANFVGGELELRDASNRVLVNETLEAAPFGAVNVRWQF